MAYFDQMVVIEKGPHPRAQAESRGSFQIWYDPGDVATAGFKGLNATKLEQYKKDLELSYSSDAQVGGKK